MKSFHLLVNITAHGFGHVAQTAPILNSLYNHISNLEVTIRSNVHEAHLRSRIKVPFTLLSANNDIGMHMSSALDVCVPESQQAYRNFHRDWPKHVLAEAQLITELGVDFVFSNVGYLALAGAKLAGVPSAAMCSLNWADIYRFYCGDDEIAAQIRACYAESDVFFRTTPGMPMADLPNVQIIAPVAELGVNRVAQIKTMLGLPEQQKLGLISMGGIASRLSIETWPRIANVTWLVQQSWQVHHPDVVALESLNMSFSDLLASSDVLVCKPGYGSFVEASAVGVPVLYVHRPDWPEAPALNAWLQQHNVCSDVSRETLDSGDIAGVLAEIWNTPNAAPVAANGAEQVVAWFKQRLAI